MSFDPRNPEPTTPRQAQPGDPWVAQPEPTQPEPARTEPERPAEPWQVHATDPWATHPEPTQPADPWLAQPGPAQPELTYRPRRDIRGQFGLVALVVALLAFALQVAAWLTSAAGLPEVGNALAWVAVLVSSAALIGALVALIAGWRRLAALGAILVSLVANPLVVAAALSAGQTFTPY
ncbi:hypothetical protein [Salinibacterium sp. ZJ454]|uniref:hypothetical protein n=1 Tax=Salinibacterium sp. ZJ454 TaxID=2708339 RepID=UPI0014208522|nr:hypothetical protein [Salinibacterium sp. ZJ454]